MSKTPAPARRPTPTAPSRSQHREADPKRARPESLPNARLRGHFDTDAGTPQRMKVRATRDGYYGEKRRRAGDVFWLRERRHYSPERVVNGTPVGWMEPVDAHTPTRTTTPQEAIDRVKDEILSTRRPGGDEDEDEGPAPSDHPLGD